MESLNLSFELNLNHWLVVSSADNLERPVSHVLLDDIIMEFSSDESLGIKDGVLRVFNDLVLSSITDESLSLSEGDIRRGSSVTLVIGNDFNFIIKVDSDTGVSGS